MRILIVEEALRDLKAHWFDYIQTITQACQRQGWSVEVACHQQVAPEIQQALPCLPLFRYARYLDNAAQRLPGDRYYGFVLHSWRMLQVLWPLFNQANAKHRAPYEQVFAPTVMLHHLLAWWIVMTFHPHRPRHLTLFFVTNPGVWDADQQRAVLPRSTALLAGLLKLFGRLVYRQRVTLAVETQGAQQEFEALSRLPFTLMPHPVPESGSPNRLDGQPTPLNFACYGFARYEKGSDLFKQAIEQILADPDFSAKFSIQWVDDFTLPDGSLCSLSPEFKAHGQVCVIDRPVMPDTYQALLAQTSCMILPYRNSSYHARVSRVAIEAAYQGIPMIYTQGGWLAETVSKYGAGIAIADESLSELVEAIGQMAQDYERYQQQAKERVAIAKQYFCAENFCKQLLGTLGTP
jgi:glycosyltransferase involved in cell wall biosynthesis